MLKPAISLVLAVFIASAYAQDNSELCDSEKNGKFDTIFSTADGKVYIIKANKFWELEGDKENGFQLKPDYPRYTNQMWPGLPAYLDTAFTDYSAGMTYFLKDGNMWMYNRNKVLEPGYPKPISDKFRGVPNNVDGAFICTGYNYFFKGDKYYGGTGSSGSISSQWRGLPNGMHAAIQFPSRGHTFFFKDNEFYKYRVWNGPVEDGYPKPVAPFWFRCDEEVLEIDARGLNENGKN